MIDAAALAPFAASFGLAMAVPRRRAAGSWLGLRFLIGNCAIPVLLYLGNVVLRLPLGMAAWAVMALAGAGFALAIARGGLVRRDELHHPVIVLAAIALVMLAVGGVPDYLPLGWDEFTNWQNFARLYFHNDGYWQTGIHEWSRGYTIGWPLAMVFPNLFAETYSDGRSLMVMYLLHLGLLGLVWDLVHHAVSGAAEDRKAAAAPWLAVLVLLAGEASWKLMPTFLLVEEVQVYLAAPVFLLLAHWSLGRGTVIGGLGRGTVIGTAGLLLLVGYLAKISTLALIGPFALAVLAVAIGRHEVRGSLRHLVLALLPLILAYVSWALWRDGRSCYSSPFSLFGGDLVELVGSAKSLGVIDTFLHKLDFFVAYKAPLTAAALAGLAISCRDRRAVPVVAMLGLYWVLTLAALYWFYLTCFNPQSVAILSSFERYMRVPLRVTHVVGLVLPLLVFAPRLIGWANRATQGWPHLPIAAGVLVAVGVVAQAGLVARNLNEVATRRSDNPQLVAEVTEARRDLATIRAILAERKQEQRPVVVVHDKSVSVGWVAAQYYALADRRDGAPRMVELVRATPDGDGLGQALAVWPITLKPDNRARLAGTIADDACRNDPTGHLLLRDKLTLPFDCVRLSP